MTFQREMPTACAIPGCGKPAQRLVHTLLKNGNIVTLGVCEEGGHVGEVLRMAEMQAGPGGWRMQWMTDPEEKPE